MPRAARLFNAAYPWRMFFVIPGVRELYAAFPLRASKELSGFDKDGIEVI